jgi:propionate CoA-transferase
MSPKPITDKLQTAAEAAERIKDFDTIAVVGGGGGLMEAAEVFAAIEHRFLTTAQPNNLTLSHALGIGDKDVTGINRFAHEGMVKRVIGGHWVWSPRMQRLAADNKIEAYCLPAGVSMQLMREIGAGRPGLITHIGLGTFVDPRFGGGKMNGAAVDELVELLEIDGKTWLRYLPFPVNVAIIRGTKADRLGNVSLEGEAANLDIFAVALAAHNSGGTVIVQVAEVVEVGAIPAHSVTVPAALVDSVIFVPDQLMSYETAFDASMCGQSWTIPELPEPSERTVRTVIAARASLELVDGAVINFGFGIPDALASLIAERGIRERYYQTIEHGTHGGELLTGSLFGFARYPTAMIDGPSQFDFYGGGGLDIAFLGFGEIDRFGNVNASKLGGVTVGPGGFIDIAQSAATVIFCGTFDAKGAVVEISDDGVKISNQGSVPKIVKEVEQITFSGTQALWAKQKVLYVTERAVFELRPEGLTLIEIAPGIDLQRDILDRIGFELPFVGDLERTSKTVYQGFRKPS